jgi:hypothetical protein
MTPFHPSVCPSQRATWHPYTPTACRRRGWPSAYRLLCRGQRYADGLLRGLSRRRPTPTATTFGRRRRAQPSASSPIPVVSYPSKLFKTWQTNTPPLTCMLELNAMCADSIYTNNSPCSIRVEYPKSDERRVPL